jgi:DMSO/TMAO reductase YedYZ molybdopterin-dependent catalytic subunit
MDGTPVGRRVFLGVVGLGTLGIVFGRQTQDFLGRALRPVTSFDPTGLSGLLPVGGFRYYTVTGGFPSKSKADYRLRVKGLVERPFTLTYDELVALPPTRLKRDFQCVTGWRVDGVHWQGVLLRDLLDRAVVKPEGTALKFTSFDGTYTESLTLDQARRSDVIVAYKLDGDDISSRHGGPVRLYVAPMYGYKSCKWLDGIEVTAKVDQGYWEDYGYDIDGWVGKSNGRDDNPT